MKRMILFRAYYSMLVYDLAAATVGVGKWEELRRESKLIYRLLKTMYKHEL